MYDFFNSPFSTDCGSTALNITPMTIGDSLILKKRAFYISDTIPDAIPVAYEKSVITLSTHSKSP